MARPGGLGKGLGALIPTGTDQRGREPAGDPDVRRSGPTRTSPASTSTRRRSPRWPSRSARSGSSSRCSSGSRATGSSSIAGERRWRAARRVGLQTIPALVRDTDDAAALEQALVENVHREDLNPLEEAAAYQQLIEDFDLTHDEVATRVGQSRATVTNTLRLLQLPPAIQRYAQGRLTPDGPRPGAARHAGPRVPGAARPPRRQRGPVGARGGGRDPGPRRTRPTTRGVETRAPKLRPPGLLELEELLGDHLETRVQISMGPRHGKVLIEFATLEDLERIYRTMTDGNRPAE